MMTPVTQVIAEYSSVDAAKAAAPGILTLDGCYGVRVSGGTYLTWRDGREVPVSWGRIQSLHERMSEPLPDGCRNVLVHDLASWLRTADATMP